MTQDKKKIIKYAILDYIKLHLQYFVNNKEERKRETDKLYAALKDLFDKVPLEQMGNIDRFCENGRFDYLVRKYRQPWGKKVLQDIKDIIINRLG
jgi:hypothetical protein